jgi:hypothetical protein
MTRLSKRELKRRIEELVDTDEAQNEPHTLVVPESSLPPDARAELPDVPTEPVYVTDPESGQDRVAVPYHARLDTTGIPLTTPQQVAAVWQELDETQLDREIQLRKQNDDPIPPVLRSGAA